MRFNRLMASWLTALLLLLSIGTASAADHDNRSPGTLLWENRGQIEPRGGGLAVAAKEDIVVAAGNVCDDTTPGVSSCNWFVRAHNARNGQTLWEDRLNAGLYDRSQDVVIEGDRAFASGWFQTPAVSGLGRFDFVVRAYDLRRGTLLWQQQIDRGLSDFAEQIAARAGRVFAVGRVRGVSGTSDFAIFAFDAATGAELWESVTDVFRTDIAFGVTVDREMVFTAGPVRNFSSLLVRAHDARTGQLIWQDEVPGGQMFTASQGRLATQHGLLFVAGGIMNQAGNQDFMVRAYNEETGALRWVQQLDAGGNDEAQSLYVRGNRLFAGGFDGCDASFLACSFSVRALAIRTGAVLWHDRFQATPGGDANVNAVVARGGLVFAGGNAQDAAGLYQWTLRIYDADSGTPIKTELIPTAGGFNTLDELALGEDQLYATGSLSLSAASSDFTVRAYRAYRAEGDDNDEEEHGKDK